MLSISHSPLILFLSLSPLLLYFIKATYFDVPRLRANCEHACDELSISHTVYHGLDASLNLWSTFQAEVRPRCRVEPTHAEDVADILSVARRHQCIFAVLGGGTSPFKRASNADSGLTIDLFRMKSIAVYNNHTGAPYVTLGGGSLWADVYEALESYNMSATGTRNSLTGVVGSILGGGISFFSEHYGWACDCVLEFQVVLANSSIVTASHDVNTDLFWALKGGGNNFGIVTRVSLEAVPNPPTWYTFQRFNIHDIDLVFHRLENQASEMLPQYVWQIAVTFQWHVPSEQFVISERLVASQLPDLPKSLSRTLPNGTSDNSPVLQTVSYQRSILAMAQKMDGMNEHGYYNLFGSVTVHTDAEIFLRVAKVFQEDVEAIKDVNGLQIYIVYNPLTLNAMRKMSKRGGNALGISELDGPLTIININLHWSDAQDNSQMRDVMRRLIQHFTQAAAEIGLLHPYLFQNHAFEEQDVFKGYGKANTRRLRQIRRAVDPKGVFQRLQPGFFKLENTKAI